MAKILLDAGVDPNPLDKHGNTPLLIAAEYFMVFPFRVYTVQLLLQHPKINPHVRRVEDGKSPVMVLGILSISGRRDATWLFEDILKLGADINTQDLDGKTLMHYVMETPEPTLHQIPRLTELGAKVDVQDNQGETPLHLAVYRGSFEGCSVLLRRFVNRDIPNRSGKLPIDIAREKGYPRIVALLNNRYMPGG